MTHTTETPQILQSGYSKNTTRFSFTPFTLENWKQGSNTMAIDRNGNLRRVKITSIKTWKTRPNVEIHWKYGLYEYGITTITPTGQIGVILGNAEPIHPDANASESGQGMIIFVIAIIAIVICLYLACSGAARLAGYTDVGAMLDALTHIFQQ